MQSKLKEKSLPWERAKTFTGSALFSEFFPINSINEELTVALDINGKRRQTGTVAMMIYPPEVVLQEVLSFIELEDGDIVMTGTPSGVGPVLVGDVFEAFVMNKESVLVSKIWQAL